MRVSPFDTRIGDLVWFGPKHPSTTVQGFRPKYNGSDLENWKDFPASHVGVVAELNNGDPQIIHASYQENTIALWSLSRFRTEPDYEVVYAVDRIAT